MTIRNPVLDRLEGIKKVGKAGVRSEQLIAKKLGAKQTMASGACDSDKGDMHVEGKNLSLLLESKSTQAESMSVKYAWLAKIYQEALEVNKVPALSITFTNEYGRPYPRGEWVAVPLKTFRELIGDSHDND